MKSNTGKKLAAGALLAGVAGYVAGVLTAPKSGKETRQDIKSAATKAMREAEKQLKTLHSELTHLMTEVKKQASSASGKSKTEIDKALAKGKAAKENVREVLSAIHEGDAHDPDLAEAVKNAKAATKALGKYLKK
jgi:gas vesicle protein